MTFLWGIQLGMPLHFTPDHNSWPEDIWSAQLHLWRSVLTYFSLQSQKTQLLSLALSHVQLIYSTSLKLLILGGLGLWPHINPLQDKTTLNYQGNKCNLPDLPSSYWTPSTKNPWWMNSGLMFSVLPQQEKTEQPLRQLLFKRTITVESHMACQSCYRPSALPFIPLKDHHNLYYTTGTLEQI